MDGETGTAIPAADRQALGNASVRYPWGTELLEMHGIAVCNRIEERCTIAAMVDLYIELTTD